MEVLVMIFAIIVAILLILAVLVQNSKGGGLASNFGASNNQFGVKKTSDFLEKLTWGLAIALVVLCLTATLVSNRDGGDEEEGIESVNVEKAKESAPAPQNLPQTAQPDASTPEGQTPQTDAPAPQTGADPAAK
ncbi:MAG TPA: preprotein translocase subunit SecG [Cytophagaceae bacterium]|jgi:preprotein translocase subunit SecG